MVSEPAACLQITGSLAAKASKRLARLQDVLGAEGVPSMDPNLFGEMLPWSLALGVSVVAGVLGKLKISIQKLFCSSGCACNLSYCVLAGW